MFGISKIINAINKLVVNLQALAATVGEINEGLRTQLRLDARKPALPEAPTTKRRKVNGE